MSNESSKSTKNSKQNECQELKNIQYKTMLLNHGNKKSISSITKDVANLDLLLEEETKLNKKESWNKLDKSIKLDKINEYIKILISKYKLGVDEITTLKDFVLTNLNKKNLCKNKDVIYIKETGVLENIPNLQFSNNTRKFTLKKSPQHVSTAKALGPKRNKNRITRSKHTNT
jgi:hypothetical protein